jgi:hypothetical protein
MMGEKEQKYKTCIHAQDSGQKAVWVDPGCPRANMLRGQLVSSKKRCEECRRWKRK